MRPRAWFTFASASSLVLLVATAALWAQSRTHVYALFYHASQSTLAAVIRPGTAELTVYHDAFPWPDRLKLFNEPDDIVPNGKADEFVNYMLFRQTNNRIPLWLLAVLDSLLPLTWIAQRLTLLSKPLDYHVCPTCSYDLTANTSGTCPECGTPLAANHAYA